MKPKLYMAAFIAISLFPCQRIFSQANTALSNLVSPTAVNRDLSPGSNNTLNLGVGATNWKNIYIGGIYYLKNLRIMHAPGTSNFFSGPNAGNLATTGTSNAAIGNNAMELNTTGSNNTALGYTALRSNTLGGRNTAVGLTALYNNTSGGYNTAVGERTMYNNKTGIYNTAIGSLVLFANTSGANNSALGYRALYSNNTGYSNVAMGAYSLFSNTTGHNLVAIGDSALYSQSVNTSNYYVNTAIGSKALSKNTTGFSNTATGFQALTASVTGSYNTATGGYALTSNTTGTGNTAVGLSASYGITTGSYNVSVGISSLTTNKTGSNNTALGANANTNADGFTNATAIGYGAVATASNQVMLGNTNITAVKAAGSFVIYSDGRYKKDVNENVPGLEFIKMLRPVTYHYDIKGINERIGVTKIKTEARSKDKDKDAVDEAQSQRSAEDAAITAKEKKLYTGFVAQEVEAAAKKLNYDFSGVYAPQNDNDAYGLSYSDFVVPLVRALQQLSDKNDSLQARIERLESMLKISPSSESLSSSSLGQNSPNPFRGNTVISYAVPQGLNTAQIVVYDAAGKTLKQINISGQGRGTVNLNAATLPSGTYHYSLYVNGKIVDTRKMVLIK